MRIFLTGATGYIGSAVLDALVRGGHDVTALVRDNEKAARVAARGGRPVVGTLTDPGSYRAAADAQDGYIHTALDTTGGRAESVDQLTIDTLIAAGKRPRTAGASTPATRFLIYTSAIWVLGRTTDPADEQTPPQPIVHSQWRHQHEEYVLTAATPTFRTIAIRPGVVYGGGQGIVGDLFKSAANGLVRVIGDGNNHWPLIYDRDLADVYLRLSSREDAAGVYHANDEGDERVNDIVAAISTYLTMRPDVRHVPIEEARHKMGPYADALSLDQVIRSPRVRALGWSPSLRSVASNAARLLEEWRNNK
jgi:nucleoside-diphosphate-sugar epimerase